MASEELEAHEAALPRAQRRGVRVAVPWASTRTRRGINIAARVLQRQVGVYRRPRRTTDDYAANVLHARGFAHTRCCDVWCVAAVSKPDVTRVFRGFRVVKGHTGCVNAAAFSHDGNLIASGGDDTRVLVWRLKSMDKPLRVFSNHHDSNIFDLAFDWEDSHILSCGNDARVNLIDIHRGTCVLVRVWPHTLLGADSVVVAACVPGPCSSFNTARPSMAWGSRPRARNCLHLFAVRTRARGCCVGGAVTRVCCSGQVPEAVRCSGCDPAPDQLLQPVCYVARVSTVCVCVDSF